MKLIETAAIVATVAAVIIGIRIASNQSIETFHRMEAELAQAKADAEYQRDAVRKTQTACNKQHQEETAARGEEARTNLALLNALQASLTASQ